MTRVLVIAAALLVGGCNQHSGNDAFEIMTSQDLSRTMTIQQSTKAIMQMCPSFTPEMARAAATNPTVSQAIMRQCK